MKITVVGAGNLGLAMAAHLGRYGNRVTLWNRSRSTIEKLIKTRTIYCQGVIEGPVKVDHVTDDIREAIRDPDVIFITTPANSHRELAELIGKSIRKESVIVLNPGRTFGALEFREVYREYNKDYIQTLAETQTTIHVSRKTGADSVNIIALKLDVLISTFDGTENEAIISKLPECLRQYLIPAKSMIETSIGNVGMIFHCAPLLLNTGWTESQERTYKYYYDGITPTVGGFIEKIDRERVEVSRGLGYEVESAKEWLKRTYQVEGDSLYECIQSNEAYRTIDAPNSLKHRYIFEDIPNGLVPLEAVGRKLGLVMMNTGLIIDLASSLMDVPFREIGRNLGTIIEDENNCVRTLF